MGAGSVDIANQSTEDQENSHNFDICDTSPQHSLHLPPHQPPPKVKAILIALQRPHLARRPQRAIDAVGLELLGLEHAPVRRDAQHARLHAALGLERNNLVRMQPMAVVLPLEVAREPRAEELGVQSLEAREHAREQALDLEGRQVLAAADKGEEGVEAGGGAAVVGVDADAEDDLVVSGRVGAVGEDAADLDVGGFGGLGGVARVDVVGPLELDGELGVGAGVVGLDGFDGGDGGEVLDEDDGAGSGEVGGVVDDGGEEQASGWGDPDVGASAAAGDLGGGCEGEAGGELGEEFVVSCCC